MTDALKPRRYRVTFEVTIEAESIDKASDIARHWLSNARPTNPAYAFTGDRVVAVAETEDNSR